jgi:DNA-binding transcriptional regulator YdaS (Cro superfamily)
VAEASPLSLPSSVFISSSTSEFSRDAVHRFLRLVLERITADSPALERVAILFDLSKTDLARLFGVRRQAIAQWFESGVPPARAAKANALARLADVLERNLKRDRIPGVVRQPADAYGGLSMLEMIEGDRGDELVRQVEGVFDWPSA